MKRIVLALALTLPMLPASVRAEPALSGTCDVQFDVSATMHSFEGTVTTEPVTVAVDEDGAASWSVTVAVTNMTTYNAKRDKEMAEMFHAEEFPRITGTASDVRLEELTEGSTIPVMLTIRDQSLEQTGTVSGIQHEGDAIGFDVSWTVSLTSYGLKPPKVLFLVVHDDVDVTAHFALAPAGPGASGS